MLKTVLNYIDKKNDSELKYDDIEELFSNIEFHTVPAEN